MIQTIHASLDTLAKYKLRLVEEGPGSIEKAPGTTMTVRVVIGTGSEQLPKSVAELTHFQRLLS
jgi:hypothetical protein